jgi:hypothetical protein
VAYEHEAGRAVHLTSNPVDWYAARAAGMTAYILLSLVVLLGITMAGKKTFPRWPRFAVEDVHRFGGLLVGAFVSIHVFTVAIDSWLPFSIASLVIPFTSRYRPLWVGLGVAGAELLVALAVTNHYRRRLVADDLGGKARTRYRDNGRISELLRSDIGHQRQRIGLDSF